ncbi:NAD(P)H nitroreductase [Mycobacterium sp. CBMA293]|uniref:Acg family FMN-binding oxidoreductase n=1 Tax=unclassified Mycolicibacterium TaxID=2636767 RepID=UPI0012DD7291|nr:MULTISPECIES: NAD(P)H nitroreductase [unclassified Mycolicibacterium]MUL47122.1 NAD(P)H nitroreductase [Mycolicibacterium sp. CBMA 360]MUL58499.1 NAD(P)H nitroreductase [Mycolicibacterium sp. CBMA 335]MUL73957.1 NAD(P)H nitroreductase [Mycolicibacterium sp. CBMA 311]MUL93382.1 NAD(P)H nitroreductase [Mycolicibacterium sp. CBMA 230]MUM04597.1 NAD(P)H nitroreductase [Mycolicibacterium sp. CBMA 213]
MTKTTISLREIEDAVHVACRAPSFHNSQPWKWILESATLKLFVDTDWLVATDSSGRQALLSCGAALDHLRVAMAAAGWTTNVDRFPNPNNRHHLADIGFRPADGVTPAQGRAADAILCRRTDRLPFGAVADWPAFEKLLHLAVGNRPAHVDVLAAQQHTELAEASHLAEVLRMYDADYHAELAWWTAPFGATTGIPHSALVSAAESDRVDIGRSFPVTHTRERRQQAGDDQATVVVISAIGDTREDILVCGETLSAVLLEATIAGLASCTLTHLTEHPATRDIISTLTGHQLPQVLVRIGTAPPLDEVPPPTPRRPLSDVFRYRPDRPHNRN